MSGDNRNPDPGRQRPRIVLITMARFWDKGYGVAARTRELILFLSRNYSLAVAYLGGITQYDVAALQGMGARFELFILGELGRQDTPRELAQRFRRHFDESSPSSVYLIVQTELSFMLEAIPSNGRTILDTNDLVSDRTQSMEQHRVRAHFPLTQAQEISLMKRYDRVVCIQQSEFAKVAGWLGPDKVILAPHPVAAVSLPLRETSAVLGFVASKWHANVDGLRWFIEHVWPLLAQENLRLDICGYVEEAFRGLQVPNLRFLGFVDDLSAFYATIDIAINPVRYGAGLKIKTVEAMAHGIPSVVSRQGASGLEALAGQAFLLAEDAVSFADHVKALAGNYSLRQSLANAARSYAVENCSPDRCFRDLARAIDSLSSR